jgi:poly-gamma-glutamate synthesis protein (capsule biosynthesis protein)
MVLLGSLICAALLTASAGQSDIPVSLPEFAEPLPDAHLSSVTLCFTGDNLLGARMPRLIGKHGEDWPYSAVIEALQSADVTFGNLECPITDYATKTPGKSWESIQEGRNFIFKAPPEYSGRILKEAGFDVVSLANNHIMDYCGNGLLDTLAALDDVGVAWVGAGRSKDEAFASCILRRNGLRIGFLARSVIVPAASKAEDNSPGLAWQHWSYSDELSNAIQDLSPQVDIVIISFHWGIEGNRQHASYQREIARRCIDDGAHLVIGHHPHCLQGIEHYNGGVIAYSLGNFLFTGKSQLIESAILRVTASRRGISEVELLPCWVRGGKPEPAASDAKLLARIGDICRRCDTHLTDDGGEWWRVGASASTTR